MASKKGIIITAIILIGITAASFLLWIIPQENSSTLVVSDYESYLDGVKEIQKLLQESTDTEFKNLLDKKTTPEEYITMTEVTSSQITVQISEFITTKPPEAWQDSYISYMEALKKFNSYVVETKIAANMIKNNSLEDGVLHKIEQLRTETLELIERSDQQRPK